MHEVLARVPGTIVEQMESRGFSLDGLFDGLSFSRADLAEPRRRVPWDDFTVFLDRAADVLGGPEVFETLAAENIRDFEYYRGLAALFVDPAKLYEFGCLKLAGVIYGPAVRTWCRPERPGLLRAGYEIVGARQGSMPFAHGSLGAMQTIPCHLGLPPATVHAKLGPRRADFLIKLPLSATVPSRLARAGDAIVARLIEELFVDHISDLHASVEEFLPRDRKGVDRIAVRVQDRALAATQCSDLVSFREHVRHLVEDELRLRLVGLWHNDEAKAHAGGGTAADDGAVRWQLPLVVGKREVGRLVLAGDEDNSPDRAVAALQDVLPVLAAGIENAKHRERMGTQQAALADQLRCWQEANLTSEVALDAMDGQAFVITSAGDVILANAQGKTALEAQGEQLRAKLRSAAAGNHTDLEVSPLGPPELSQGRMLALRRDVAASLRARIDRAKCRWRLTRRQTDVLGHVVEGRSNKEIASLLQCAEGTVEIHVTQLLRRAAADSRGTLTAKFWMEV